MEQNIYDNISIKEVHHQGEGRCNLEMKGRCDPEEQAGRQTPQSGGWWTYTLIAICVVLLITGMCAWTFMIQINAGIKDVDAKVAEFKTEVQLKINCQEEKNKQDLLQNIENVVEKINSQEEKNKQGLLQNIQNIVEKINSQGEKNKQDLLQNIQNVGANIKSKIEEQVNKLQNIQLLGAHIKSKIEEQVNKLQNIQLLAVDETSSWKRLGSKWYHFSQNSNTWEKAREQCVAMGATLTMVKTQEEMEFLAKGRTEKYWVGLSDAHIEGTWKWLDGTSPANGLWGQGEPNNQGNPGEEDCGETHGKLNDFPCDTKLKWICEKSLVI